MGWEERWQADETPWDAGAPCPSLIDLLRAVPSPAPRSGRALVPGCGRGWDCFAIVRESAMHATGLDLAPSSRAAFERCRDESAVLPSHVRLEIADFFEYAPEEPYDFAWDYTFLCALDPAQRDAWGEAYARVMAPGGVLGVLVFPLPDAALLADREDPDAGPPFVVDADSVAAHLPGFELLSRDRDIRSHAGREDAEELQLYRRLG